MSALTSHGPAGGSPLPPPSDEVRYELLDGQWVEMPPMGAWAAIVASDLVWFIGSFARTQNIGKAVSEVLFRLPINGNRNRRLDGAYVSYQRWPKGKPVPGGDNAWDVVPNLAIEVVSPNDLAEEIHERVREFFQAGVELTWVVWPQTREIYVYESPARITVLNRQETLDGGAFLPGFRLPQNELFQEQAPTA